MRLALVACLVLLTATLAGCSSGARDEDGDGLRDKTEKDWPTILVDYLDRRVRLDPTSDVDKVDTDGDGLSDFDEFFRKTDPRDPDTDHDGLTDCQETVHTVAAECEDPDFAGDYDHGYGTNPARADSDPGPVRFLNQPGRFTDETGTLVDGHVEWGDGISDRDEVFGYEVHLNGDRVRNVTSDPRDPDTDGDGLEDGEEALLYAADPSVEDTDGDSCRDGQDPWPSSYESYAFGLGTFRLQRDMDPEGGADLQLTISMGGRVLLVPPTGHMDAKTGQDIDLFPYEPSPFRYASCPLTPAFPWMQVAVLALDADTNGGQTLDISSVSDPSHPTVSGSGASGWFNVRTGQMAWTIGGSEMDSLPFRGADATIDLTPRVAFSQDSQP